MLVHAITADPVYEFAADVREGLSKPGQKELLSKYLYDDVGSALFEVISLLPEYGLTRADERLIQEVLGIAIGQIPRLERCIHARPASERGLPSAGDLRQGGQPCANVLAALGVVRR